MRITFVTGNPKKAEQLGRHLGYPIDHKKLEIYEIQSLDLEEIAKHKAREAYSQLQTPVLVEDTSLVFSSLGGLPGPLIKWFLEELDNKGLCKLLDSYPDRSATAQVCFCLYDGSEFKVFKASKEGAISSSPTGDHGFGWDPVFIPQGYKKTWGEMTMEEQDETSMRKIALGELERYLRQ